MLDIDLWFIDFFVREFDIATQTRLLSETGVAFGPDKTGSLVNLVRSLGGDTFLPGSAGRGFIDLGRFEAAGIRIAFQDYVCRPYRQQYEPFVSHLSAIDLLLNEGPEGAAFI